MSCARLLPVAVTCLAACAASPKPPPPASQIVAVDAPPSATQAALPPPPPDAPLVPLGWTNTEGGGAGFLPVGGEKSFMGISDVAGVRSVLRRGRVALSMKPSHLCALADAIEPARDRVSIDLDSSDPIEPATAKCLARLHPPAFSFTMGGIDGDGSTPAIASMLSHLDDCEAVGVAYANDSVARILGDRADEPDGATLRTVALVQGRLSAQGYAAVAKRKKLRELAFRGTNSTSSPTGIAALAALPDLEHLDLSYGNVTDDDLAAFASSKRLSWLMLESTKIDGRGLAALSGLRRLAHVNLGGTLVDDAAVTELARLPNVTFLDLSGTRVTDAGVMALARMTSLEEVSLSSTRLTEASLAPLGRLPKLRTVSLPETLPRAAVEAFRAAHRKVEVRYYAP